MPVVTFLQTDYNAPWMFSDTFKAKISNEWRVQFYLKQMNINLAPFYYVACTYHSS